MSPRSVQPAWSSQRSVTKILPSTIPRTFTDFVLISPHMRACSPIVSVPVELIVPSTSPSMSSSFRNLTKPLIETPWREERRIALSSTCGWIFFFFFFFWAEWPRIVPNYSAFWKRNLVGTVASTRYQSLKIARVLVRFDHVARFIVNAITQSCDR